MISVRVRGRLKHGRGKNKTTRTCVVIFRSTGRGQEVRVVHAHMSDRRQHTNDAEERVPSDQPRVSTNITVNGVVARDSL